MRIQSDVDKRFFSFEGSRLNSVYIYFLAFLIQVVLALVFIDYDDGPVFFQTGNDIIVDGTNIYYEGSIHSEFNYLPLAYLIVLPGQFLYHILSLDNQMLQRLFLKFPLLIGDIGLAISFRRLRNKSLNYDLTKNTISFEEVFILFNPVIIFTSSIKGQIDIYVGIFILLSWNAFESREDMKSGVFISLAILVKQYTIIFAFFLFIVLFKESKTRLRKYIFGSIIGALPVLIIGALLNFKGMIKHGILYHLQREPSGYALARIVYETAKILDELYFKTNGSVPATVDSFFTIILAFALIYLGIQLYSEWNNKDCPEIILVYAIKGWIVFCLLNSSFFIQYLVPVVVYVSLYQLFDTELKLNTTHLAWNITLIPVTGIIRLAQMTPKDVQDYLGANWVIIMWLILTFSHLLLVWIFKTAKIINFEKKATKCLYLIFFIILIISLFIQIFVANQLT